MSTAGAASWTMDLSMKKGITIMSQLADTLPTILKQLAPE